MKYIFLLIILIIVIIQSIKINNFKKNKKKVRFNDKNLEITYII